MGCLYVETKGFGKGMTECCRICSPIELCIDMVDYNCNRFRVGDKGQRYEITYLDEDGDRQVFGWADDPSNVLKAIHAHPRWHSAKVIDRRSPVNGI